MTIRMKKSNTAKKKQKQINPRKPEPELHAEEKILHLTAALKPLWRGWVWVWERGPPEIGATCRHKANPWAFKGESNLGAPTQNQQLF